MEADLEILGTRQMQDLHLVGYPQQMLDCRPATEKKDSLIQPNALYVTKKVKQFNISSRLCLC